MTSSTDIYRRLGLLSPSHMTVGKGEKIPHNLCSDLHFMMYCPKEEDHESWTGYKHLYLVSQSDKEV